MKGHLRSLVVVLGIASASLGSAAARADEPSTVDTAAEARQQYQQGTQAFQQKKYSEAALHFEAAASFRTNAVALYTAGLAWDLASRPERAADAYGRALEVGGLDGKQTTLAKERVAQLERTLGTVSVSAPDGWKVQLDTSTEVATPARLHGPAGVHTLSARAPGKAVERRDVTVEAGKLITVELKDEPKAKAMHDPETGKATGAASSSSAGSHASSPPFWITRRVVGVGLAGVGLAALGSALVLGINATSAKEAYDAGPTRESFDHASSLQMSSNVALISGAALMAGGLVLVLWPDKDEGSVRVGFTPTGARMSGRF